MDIYQVTSYTNRERSPKPFGYYSNIESAIELAQAIADEYANLNKNNIESVHGDDGKPYAWVLAPAKSAYSPVATISLVRVDDPSPLFMLKERVALEAERETQFGPKIEREAIRVGKATGYNPVIVSLGRKEREQLAAEYGGALPQTVATLVGVLQVAPVDEDSHFSVE